jgi:hypothetical protein
LRHRNTEIRAERREASCEKQGAALRVPSRAASTMRILQIRDWQLLRSLQYVRSESPSTRNTVFQPGGFQLIGIHRAQPWPRRPMLHQIECLVNRIVRTDKKVRPSLRQFCAEPRTAPPRRQTSSERQVSFLEEETTLRKNCAPTPADAHR